MTELQLGMEKDLDDKKTEEILKSYEPELQEKNIELLFDYIKKNSSMEGFNEDIELISYFKEGVKISVDFNDFYAYYSFLPIHQEVNDKETLINNIYQYVYNDYLIEEARKLGLYDADTFLLDQQNFRNNLLYNEYLKNEIISKITINSEEIMNYFTKHKTQLTKPKIITADLFVFKTEEEGLRNIHTIQSLLRNNQNDKLKDTPVIKSLYELKKNYKINIENHESYPKEFLDFIVNMGTEALSFKPLPLNDKYVLVYKISEEGQYIPNLSEVSDDIYAIIKEAKIEKKRQERLTELKKKYPIEIDKTGI